jgi:hypothetical protein
MGSFLNPRARSRSAINSWQPASSGVSEGLLIRLLASSSVADMVDLQTKGPILGTLSWYWG